MEQAVELFARYGMIAYFAFLGTSSFGVPVPVKLLMLLVGAMVQQGDVTFLEALLIGTLGAVAGDQLGFFVGRFGGRPVIERLTARIRGAEALAKADRVVERWGDAAVFFSRWLITPIGPWLNLVCGSAHYPWLRFTAVGVIGETLWILLYLSLGIYFSNKLEATADLLASLSWLIFGLFMLSVLGWRLGKYFRAEPETS